jgi:propionyl-CoA synthetase
MHIFKPKPGSATKPSPGFKVEIMDHDNQIISEPGKLGRICIKLPMPPSFMLTLYRNDEAFISKYLKETPGYYTAGV